MEIVEEAFRLLYPDREFNYEARVKYTDHFKEYGANVKLRGNVLEFGLSKRWREISREIKIGLIQELLIRILKRGIGYGSKSDMGRTGKSEINTMYIDLYNSFVKNLHIAIPKTEDDPVLSDSFNRVNEKYFYGLVEKPNLVWGSKSRRSLGSYDYKRDTLKMSRVFVDISKKDPVLLDFVMYHEILHKQHKYKHNMGNNRFHDTAFRKKEKEFEDYEEVDKRLKNALRRARIKSMFWFD
ncbi:MAG: hypothetical protein NT001_02705 [Candidatus Woesearchaeota archaeon]|nr:hypothetical protein [Candidatus Woesearchaeota archaeon]